MWDNFERSWVYQREPQILTVSLPLSPRGHKVCLEISWRPGSLVRMFTTSISSLSWKPSKQGLSCGISTFLTPVSERNRNKPCLCLLKPEKGGWISRLFFQKGESSVWEWEEIIKIILIPLQFSKLISSFTRGGWMILATRHLCLWFFFP